MPNIQRRTRDAAAPPTADLGALYQTLLGQIGNPQEVDTPNLGRVVFPSAANIGAALNLLRMEAARAAGIPTTGVIVVTYNRGLGPTNGGCCL